MMMSAKALIEKSDSEWKERDPTEIYPGIMVTAIIISAHCAELLLKYKIKQEGRIISRNTHDLYYLYKTLNADSKAAIQKEFDKQLLTETPPNGWESAESVFQKTRDACKNWRYAVEPNNIPSTYPRGIYIAAASVYKTIPILDFRMTSREVTDPAIIARVLSN